jgi:Arc/MetJ-type ribon-helix-helix transcriptional regulator
MIRTQVQLTENQIQALRQAARATGKSVSELVRQGVDQYLADRGGIGRREQMERAKRVAGRFSSGLRDVSAKHDKYLAEAFGR